MLHIAGVDLLHTVLEVRHASQSQQAISALEAIGILLPKLQVFRVADPIKRTASEWRLKSCKP